MLKKSFSGAKISSIYGESGDGEEAAAERAFQASVRLRDRYWEAIGAIEPYVIGGVSPSLTGDGPDWPTMRQAYMVIRRDHSIILATDGMSDPFDILEGEGNGFGVELFLETADIPAELAGEKGDIGGIMKSWAFHLLKLMAATVAEQGWIIPALERLGVLSIEFPGVRRSWYTSGQLPDYFITGDDCLGALLGGPDPDFPTRIEDMPLSPVRMVPVVPITAAELDYVRQGGVAARRELVARLAALPSGHRADLNRPSLEGRD